MGTPVCGYFSIAAFVLSACGANVTSEDAPTATGTGGDPASNATAGQGGTPPTSTGGASNGGAPPSITCDEVCANIPRFGCQTPETPVDPCHVQCERVQAAPDRCDAQTEAFLSCILTQGACTQATQRCLPQLAAWTECNGTFCGSCVTGAGTGWSYTSCFCLGTLERTSDCGSAPGSCECALWGEPVPDCDWPYEIPPYGR